MRYSLGGHSGEGSRGGNAKYKADVINRFIQETGVRSTVEFGCGDGHQLRMLEFDEYTGIDVSPAIISRCKKLFENDPSKRFLLDTEFCDETFDLSMSVDVIFHLVEDAVYASYLTRLFASSGRYVIIYSTDVDMSETRTPHVRHRHVSADVERRFPNFRRMPEAESSLPPPVRYDRGHPTMFLFYERVPVAEGGKASPT